jgi:hypothetical protein
MNGNFLGRRAGFFFFGGGRLFLSFPWFVWSFYLRNIVFFKVSAKKKKKKHDKFFEVNITISVWCFHIFIVIFDIMQKVCVPFT